MAKNALKAPRLAQLIYRLVKENQPANIIELGTCLGITTAYLSKARPEADIVTIEGCPQTAKVAYRNFNELDLHNIELQVGNFDKLFPELISQTEKLDFVYIDGNHRKGRHIELF